MGVEERKQRIKRQKKENYLWFLFFGILLAGIGPYLMKDYFQEWKNEQIYASLRMRSSQFSSDIDERQPDRKYQYKRLEGVVLAGKKGKIFCRPVVDFGDLAEINEDIYAWIVVPGTAVEYPVLQCETDNYYLEHNLDHSEGYPGCIYSNACNQREFSDYNTVIYGHNLSRDRMFGSLHRFEEEEFFEENREIILYTSEYRLTYEVLAATAYYDFYIPAYYDLTTYEGMAAFWESVKSCEGEENSHVRSDTILTKNDQLVTLSTCIRHVEDHRYLVVGRLIEKAWYYPETEEGNYCEEIRKEK